jgi:hypothetical protein
MKNYIFVEIYEKYYVVSFENAEGMENAVENGIVVCFSVEFSF